MIKQLTRVDLTRINDLAHDRLMSYQPHPRIAGDNKDLSDAQARTLAIVEAAIMHLNSLNPDQPNELNRLCPQIIGRYQKE